MKLPVGSNNPEKQQDDQNQQDQSEPTAWAISPISTVGPGWKSSEEQQNQNH